MESVAPTLSDADTAILLVISRIPRGKVASYGQVAEMAGLRGRARLVGRVLSRLPTGSKVPWYRVVNAAGRISFASDSASYRRQRQYLESEGVTFNGQRINLARFRWTP